MRLHRTPATLRAALCRSLGLASALAAAGCTIVVPGGQDAGTKIVPIPVPTRPDALPPPNPLEASVLYVVNLQRSSANLASAYAGVMTGLASYLQSVGLTLDNMGVMATYSDEFGPRLLLGRNQENSPTASPPLAALIAGAAAAGVTDYNSLLTYLGGMNVLGNINDGDLPTALQLLASSGQFDGDGQTSEAQAVIELGEGINLQPLPSTPGLVDRQALFDRPRDLFIVVYLQPLERRCALGTADCQVDGRSPADIFQDTDSSGNLTWLAFPSGGIRPEQVVQVAIATSEGEDIDSFRTRCAAVPGFPINLFDVMEPSANLYFTPLMAALDASHPGTGQMADFCQLIGQSPTAALTQLGTQVAGVLGSVPHPTTE